MLRRPRCSPNTVRSGPVAVKIKFTRSTPRFLSRRTYLSRPRGSRMNALCFIDKVILHFRRRTFGRCVIIIGFCDSRIRMPQEVRAEANPIRMRGRKIRHGCMTKSMRRYGKSKSVTGASFNYSPQHRFVHWLTLPRKA